MAKEQLPDYKTKQALLYDQNTPAEKLENMGKRFMEAGWLYDAIDFFQKAKSRAGLEMAIEMAAADGDVFLLRKALKASGQEGDASLWQRTGERARELGKFENALEAFRLSGDKKAMDAVYQIARPKPANPAPQAEAEKSEPAT